MDREAWRAAVPGIAKTQKPLSNWTDSLREMDLLVLQEGKQRAHK